MSQAKGKNPVVAVVLSFIIPGLGQFYINEIGKGIMFLILAIVAWSLNATIVGLVFGVPLLLVTGIWSMVAAYNGATAA